MAIKTIGEFGAAILEGVSVDIDDLPKGSMAAWFADPATNRPTIFRVNAAVPFDAYSRVIAIFQGEETIRVYTLPAAPPEPRPADWKDQSPSRFTLTKTAPTYVAEVMNLDAMAALLIDEWDTLGDTDSAEEELAAVIEYLRGKNLTSLAEALEAGEHHADDGEPDLEAKTETQPPAAPAVTS